MKRFAELLENKVQRVINAESKKWCEDNLGGVWVETFKNNLASINGFYDKEKNKFIPPKPYNSWTYNEEGNFWMPPISEPDDGKLYFWNESILNWEEMVVEETQPLE